MIYYVTEEDSLDYCDNPMVEYYLHRLEDEVQITVAQFWEKELAVEVMNYLNLVGENK